MRVYCVPSNILGPTGREGHTRLKKTDTDLEELKNKWAFRKVTVFTMWCGQHYNTGEKENHPQAGRDTCSF